MTSSFLSYVSSSTALRNLPSFSFSFSALYDCYLERSSSSTLPLCSFVGSWVFLRDRLGGGWMVRVRALGGCVGVVVVMGVLG
jgi:hypothetical protein